MRHMAVRCVYTKCIQLVVIVLWVDEGPSEGGTAKRHGVFLRAYTWIHGLK